MHIITLNTDWGYGDWYLGQVKGQLYSAIEDITVLDLNHSIKKFDIRTAAFVVKNSCMNFPKGTIHIIDANTYEDSTKAFIVIKYNEQYYICTDNGLPSIVFDGKEVEITDCTNVFSDSNYYTFAVTDLFVKIAKIIIEDGGLDNLGNKQDGFKTDSSLPLPIIDKNLITCEIIYIDDYGNAYLNIDDKTFKEALNGRGFELQTDVDDTIKELSASYADKATKGKSLLTISSTRNLELAVREDNISRLMGYSIGQQIKIKIV